jgi:hypothetical protein
VVLTNESSQPDMEEQRQMKYPQLFARMYPIEGSGFMTTDSSDEQKQT